MNIMKYFKSDSSRGLSLQTFFIALLSFAIGIKSAAYFNSQLFKPGLQSALSSLSNIYLDTLFIVAQLALSIAVLHLSCHINYIKRETCVVRESNIYEFVLFVLFVFLLVYFLLVGILWDQLTKLPEPSVVWTFYDSVVQGINVMQRVSIVTFLFLAYIYLLLSLGICINKSLDYHKKSKNSKFTLSAKVIILLAVVLVLLSSYVAFLQLYDVNHIFSGKYVVGILSVPGNIVSPILYYATLSILAVASLMLMLSRFRVRMKEKY